MPVLKNTRWEAYCQGRFKKLSKTAAYLAAGYGGKNPEKNADRNAHKLERDHPEIVARIAELEEKVSRANVMGRQEALEALTRMGRATLADFIDHDQEGLAFFNFNKDIPNPEAVKELSCLFRYDKKGLPVGHVSSIKLHSPREAIMALAKLEGWEAPKKIAVDIRKVLDTLPDEALEEICSQELEEEGQEDS